MTLISSLAAVIAPVILVTLVGYGWGRMRESFDHVLVTRLVTLVASPALVFSTLATMTVPEAELAGVARAMAAEIAANAPLAVQASKRMMRMGLEETFNDHVHHVFLPLLPLLRTEDAKEGMRAFMEKRPAKFEGR